MLACHSRCSSGSTLMDMDDGYDSLLEWPLTQNCLINNQLLFFSDSKIIVFSHISHIRFSYHHARLLNFQLIINFQSNGFINEYYGFNE